MTGGGYGCLGIGPNRNEIKSVRAHRLSYEHFVGPIPEGEGWHGVVVMHKCDNRACVNPDHLTLGTQTANIHDMVVKGRGRNSCGEDNGLSKLTEAEVLAIRSQQGLLSSRKVAAQYGITHRTVLLIWKRRVWKHL